MAGDHHEQGFIAERSFVEINDDIFRCFKQHFSLFDLNDGRLLHDSGSQPTGNADFRMKLFRDAMRKHDEPLVFEVAPVAFLVLPLRVTGHAQTAAIGTFVLRDVPSDEPLDQLAERLTTDSDNLRAWIEAQPTWTVESLGRLAAFTLDKLAADLRVGQLEREVEKLSETIGQSYEEISLTYRVIENLRGSQGPADLASLAMDWLVTALPTEQAILELYADDESTAPLESHSLSFGEQHLNAAEYRRLLDHLRPENRRTPLVLNAEATGDGQWPFPCVRELVVVPLCAYERTVGWLACVNHARGGWFGTHQAKLLNAVGTIIGMRVMINEASRVRAMAETANRAKSAFLAKVSHEFRTPLNAITTFSYMLEGEAGREDEQRRDGLQTVGSCARKLIELVEDILEFSKLDAGPTHVDRIPCRLDELIVAVVSENEARAAAKGLRIEATSVGGIFANFRSDPQRLRKLMVILVRNAIKFTERGGVRIDVEGNERCLRISVHDTGIGIPSEKLNAIFSPFEQADNSATRCYGGLGLGLAICKRIAQSLGGDLTVKSQPGVGSTFTLNLESGAPGQSTTAVDAIGPENRASVSTCTTVSPGTLPASGGDESPAKACPTLN